MSLHFYLGRPNPDFATPVFMAALYRCVASVPFSDSKLNQLAMNEKECLLALGQAIANRFKVHLQMKDTPEDNFILFHPHAELVDPFTGASYPGLIEKHHTSAKINYFGWPRLSGIKTVLVTNDKFEPNHDIWNHLKLDNIEIRLKA